MGFLEVGKPLTWEDTKEYYDILEYVIDHGSTQFLEVFNRVKGRKNDVLKWGDEVEFHIYRTDPQTGNVQISLCADPLLKKLETEDKAAEAEPFVTWHPEYGSWMIEATPAKPYGGFSSDLVRVEPSMRYRRQRIIKALDDDHSVIGTVAWPRMGCGAFTFPATQPVGPVAMSAFLADEVINPHPRFATLTRNIRKRRGRNVDIRVPLFQDSKTDMTGGHDVVGNDGKTKEKAKEIYMDSMGFGMGCCCLQVTFQARDVVESRHLYDQLAVLCPIFLALTAGSPVFKGLVADTDVRWSTIAQSVDCRTPTEYGFDEGESKRRGSRNISKSRYDSIDMYISASDKLKPEYNDNNSEIHEPTLEKLMQSGVDETLARHISHLFIRDPLVVFGDRVNVDDHHTTEHFENIQSTNWQTMRWKPPPLDTEMGWRVEFRPMEMQLTDFGNAAYTVVIVLLTRVILFFDLNLYVPISKVDANMKTAHRKDAVLKEKFYFRKNLVPLEAQCGPFGESEGGEGSIPDGTEDEYELMTIEEIMLGKGENFPGLIPLIWAYLDIIECDESTQTVVEEYIDYLTDVIRGKLPTTAKWMRDFIRQHADYKHDSVVSEIIQKDLIKHCSDISNGVVQEPALLGSHKVCELYHDNEVSRLKLSRCNSVSSNKNTKLDFKKLRGASFQQDVGMTNAHAYKCAVVRALVDKYKSQPARKHVLKEALGFANTPPFFPTV